MLHLGMQCIFVEESAVPCRVHYTFASTLFPSCCLSPVCMLPVCGPNSVQANCCCRIHHYHRWRRSIWMAMVIWTWPAFSAGTS